LSGAVLRLRRPYGMRGCSGFDPPDAAEPVEIENF